MEKPKHTKKEILDFLQDESAGWFHGEEKVEHFYSGEVSDLVNSNIEIPFLEVAGSIKGSRFISDAKDYVGELAGQLEEVAAIAIKCKDGVLVVSKKTKFFIRDKRVEGYWYSREKTLYPMPIPYRLSDQEAEEIYQLIKLKEEESQINHCRGFSISRIDQTTLDFKEFEHEHWIWPGQYAEHYVLKYKVKPSEDFLGFIGWRNKTKEVN